jgi:hypothetical protein
VPQRKYTDEQLIAALPQARNMRDLLMKLGLAPRGGNYETVRRRMQALNIVSTQFQRGRGGVQSRSDEEIVDAVKGSTSLAQVLVKLGVRQGGGTQASLRDRIENLNLDTSHFLGVGWRRGSRVPVRPARPLDQILVIGRFLSTNNLRARLLREGLKEHRCEECRRDTWNGRPIPLELDHVNGKRDDNRLENLRILCPNCHAQTPTYRGRNIGLTTPVSSVAARVAQSGETRGA